MLQATSWVHYTTSCNTQSSAPEDGQNNCPKYVELTGIINKPLLMHLVGCLYYLYQWWTVKQISDNEIYLFIKYIKSVLWRVAKCLSNTEEARCLKVNTLKILALIWNVNTVIGRLSWFLRFSCGTYQCRKLKRWTSFHTLRNNHSYWPVFFFFCFFDLESHPKQLTAIVK